MTKNESLEQMKRLKAIIAKLRDPIGGCPWDLQQTHQSLLPHLIEETYEFVHAVELKDFANMEEEIGDLLLQVLLHCQLATESGHFDLESCSQKLAQKLVERHPHVFESGQGPATVSQVLINWEKIKNRSPEKKSLLSETLLHLPALLSAGKIGKKTALVGFDWKNAQEVLAVVESEWHELTSALATQNHNHALEELGDLLFSLAQLARHLDANPEDVLRQANKKFLRRFWALEQLVLADQLLLENLTPAQMEHYWQQVKQQERCESLQQA